MNRITQLRAAKDLNDVAALLGYKPKAIAYLIYKQNPATRYVTFQIPKRSGGKRTLSAPNAPLKKLQRRLSDLLQDCIAEINKERKITKSISHGFRRGHSIITNAKQHQKKRYVFNCDLSDFFPSLNFGRVRGFFITNKNFSLDPAVATILAQIGCHNNCLPQGSPCSPVISNLIGHILDIRLAALAEKYGCEYSRYADDLTFSTGKKKFPNKISKKSILSGEWYPGKELLKEIKGSGFSLNPSKTRMQYQRSRQDVTGLIVNKKVNIRVEYWKSLRAMTHSLFSTGSFYRTKFSRDTNGTLIEAQVPGTLAQMEGMFGFVDSVKFSQWSKVNPHPGELMSYEKKYAEFMFYRRCVANEEPTIFFEGKTDNIYVRAAIESLVKKFPELGVKTKGGFNLLVKLINYTQTTARLLKLSGGSGNFNKFISDYSDRIKSYKVAPLKQPVILFIDNDSGSKGIVSAIKNKYKHSVTGSEPFVHITDNLYLVATPKTAAGEDTAIEDFFPSKLLKTKVGSKVFNKNNNTSSKTEYGKHIFAEKVVKPNKSSIDFKGFSPLLQRIVDAIADYNAKTSVTPPPQPPA